MDAQIDDYTADKIVVLEGLDGVRKRPAMYIGDTGKRGLHHLVFEVIDNSIDEALAGFCKNIWVIIHKDGSVSVRDDGRGIPTETHPQTGRSTLETVILILHAGGKFDKNSYKVSGGLHGVGISVVSALSEQFDVEVHRNNKRYHMSSAFGKLSSPTKEVGDSPLRGTMVRFKPDAKIFSTIEFEYDYLKERIMELAFLNKTVTIFFKDERTEPPKEETFHYEGGLSEFVKYLNQARTPLHNPFYYEKESEGMELEFSIQYTDSFNAMLYSFVNDIKTTEGGTHVVGFRAALTRAINDYGKTNRLLKEDKKISGEDAIEGITAVVSVKIAEPQFEGQTKTKLGNSEVKGIVESLAYSALQTYLDENPPYAKAILAKVLNSMEAREAAQQAKDLIRRKNIFETSILPGKLADCTEEDPLKSELFLLEGESAGGSAKLARDRKFQAILPLKGKILNVEKAPIHKVLTSEEIKAIVLSLGSGFGEDLDPKKLRYHKVIIACDADVDGSHIRTLILTLFYRHFKQLIEAGHIYIAQPPLYKIWKGKQVKYAYTDAEKEGVLMEMGEGGVTIQRYKGLGEMNPDQLWETTMDPEKRILKRVTIEDGMKADELFTILMGEEVEPRRKFIEAYAAQVKNLDI